MMANTLWSYTSFLTAAMRAFGLAQVVLADQHQLAPVDAAGLVEFVEVDLDAVHGELAVDVDRAGERPERAHLDLRVGDALERRLLARRCGVERDGMVAMKHATSFHLLPGDVVDVSRKAQSANCHANSPRASQATARNAPLELFGQGTSRGTVSQRLCLTGRRGLAWQICRKPGGVVHARQRSGRDYSAACPRLEPAAAEPLERVGDRHDIGVLFRHVEEIDGVRHLAAIVNRIPWHQDPEVIGESVDHRAAHATAGGAAADDQRIDAQIDEIAGERCAEEGARVLLG